MTRTIEAIGHCRHPVVAQIHGICVGGGLEIAGLADIRICGESSRFGVPINRLGLVMAYSEIGALIRLAGEAVALEILLEGRVFDAREAKEKGLVTRVVPDAEVEAEARPPRGASRTGRRWWRGGTRSSRAACATRRPLTAEELDEGFACYGTEDFRIGRQAFLAKAKPEFKGR